METLYHQPMAKKMIHLVSALMFFYSSTVFAVELKVGDDAPLFSTKTQDGTPFDLATRKGKWTVLYLYPKASTPGCTKQACAYRDNIEMIRKLDAEVYGLSYDTVEDQAKFHKAQKLNFTLLADPDGKIVGQFGSKMPVIGLSKRWTFILDPNFKIRSIDKDVDPVQDAKKVATLIESLKSKK